MVCSTALIRPGAPSETTSSGQRRPRAPRSVRNVNQASVDSPVAVSSPTKTGLPPVGLAGGGVGPDDSALARGGDAPRREHGLGGRADVIAEEAVVKEQVVQLEL